MAGLFGLFDYSKEGPGVSKNAPQKRAFVVFFEIYLRKFWKLICAGLLHLLVSLPLITRGWADAGLAFITRNYAREKHAFIREDFFETIKKNRGQAFACGIINLLATGLLFFNMFYYLPTLMPGVYALLGMDTAAFEPISLSPIHYLVMMVTMCGYILFTWMKYYIPFLVVTFKLRTKQVYKNAFIFAIAGLKPNLLISVVLLAVYALLVGIFLLMPYDLTLIIVLMLYVLLVPAFRSFLIQFCIFPTIKKWMIDPYYKENPDADKQARLDLNLEVEEEPVAPQDEPVFRDEAPTVEEPTIPRQYGEREMRSFNRRVHGGYEDDDDTI